MTVNADDYSQTIQFGPSQDNDIPGAPNGTCISRVLYESEDQGQVDIEAFVTTVATSTSRSTPSSSTT
ncbi:MAG: hypothetical protein M9925_11170 [Chloroflexi bacterium]|nr:hypothetical protein [Chloroflexota bacterium]